MSKTVKTMDVCALNTGVMYCVFVVYEKWSTDDGILSKKCFVVAYKIRLTRKSSVVLVRLQNDL